jgi:uncharacterized cupredoxin-like copper-binding protein
MSRPFSCALLALAFAAGCGGGGGGGGSTVGGGTTAAVKTIVVEETEFRMKPSATRLTAGKTYIFRGVNKGKIPHVLEVEGPGLENETGTIVPGGSATIQLIMRNPGTYEFYCPLDGHKRKGMVAKFVVERAG